MGAKTLKAYAKVNIELFIGNRRPDGYHEISSVMERISLCDEVTVETTAATEAEGAMSAAETGSSRSADEQLPPVTLEIEDNDISRGICSGEKNLAYRGAVAALSAIRGKVGEGADLPGFRITLKKNIPAEAGLAGGSTDAAAVMLAVNSLLGNVLSVPELIAAGIKVGSDVPAMIAIDGSAAKDDLEGEGKPLEGSALLSTAVRISGIGEIVEPVRSVGGWAILVKPSEGISTKEAYDAIDRDRAEKSAEKQPDFTENRRDKNSILFYNEMEEYAFESSPETGRIRDAMTRGLSAFAVTVSGSGPTVAAYYSDEDTARRGFDEIDGLLSGITEDRGTWLVKLGGEGKCQV